MHTQRSAPPWAGRGAGAQARLLVQHATSADRRRKGQQSGAKAGWGSEMYQGAAPGIRGRDGRGTNSVRPRRPLWQRRRRGTEPTVEVGRPRATERGPEAIPNDPEVRQLPRHAREPHCQEPPAEERSPGTPDVSCLSWPPWAPLLGLAPTTTSTQSHSWPRRTLSRRVPAPPRPSRATCSAQLPPSGTEGASLPRDGGRPWRPGKDAHMRRGRLGPKQGKRELGGHPCGADGRRGSRK